MQHRIAGREEHTLSRTCTEKLNLSTEDNETFTSHSTFLRPARTHIHALPLVGCPSYRLRPPQGGYDEVCTLLGNAEGRIEVWEAGEHAVEYAAQRFISFLRRFVS